MTIGTQMIELLRQLAEGDRSALDGDGQTLSVPCLLYTSRCV